DVIAARDGASDGGTVAGDTYVPWFGGPPYYGKWQHGLPADPSFFPIAVGLQSPPNAKRYAAVGIDIFIGLYAGATQMSLDTLAARERAGRRRQPSAMVQSPEGRHCRHRSIELQQYEAADPRSDQVRSVDGARARGGGDPVFLPPFPADVQRDRLSRRCAHGGG